MRTVLHILTKTEDPLATEIIRRQRQQTEYQVEIFDLTEPEPDYLKLLEAIFSADSIHTW